MSAEAVFAALKARGWMMATAESCTGGMIGAAITDIAGSSAVFERGFITYSNAAKTEMIGVDPALIARFGAVSEPVAAQMAEGARAAAGVEIAVSVTGIAGPGGSDHKPEGLVCFGIATAAGTLTERVEFGALGRANVRQATVEHALLMVLNAVRAGAAPSA